MDAVGVSFATELEPARSKRETILKDKQPKVEVIETVDVIEDVDTTTRPDALAAYDEQVSGGSKQMEMNFAPRAMDFPHMLMWGKWGPVKKYDSTWDRIE